MMRWTAILFLFITVGCSSQLTVITEETEYIQMSDFSQNAPESENVTAQTLEEETEKLAIETVQIEEIVAEMEEEYDEMMPDSVGVALTVEKLVGQINGRPVYANTILNPIADELAAAAKTMSRSEFSTTIRESLYSETEQMGIILRRGSVYNLVKDDLLLSESLSGMSKQQSYGLISIIGQMRSGLASAQGGSHTQLRQDLSTQMGVSVDEFLEFQRDSILRDELYRQKIMPKVNVSWRDIQREFEEVSFDEEVLYEEDDTRTAVIVQELRTGGKSLREIEAARGYVTLGRINLSNDDPRIDEVNVAISEGASFATIAELVEVQDGGVWNTYKMGQGGIADIKAGALIRGFLVGATEGDIIGPLELSSGVNWFAVLEVQEPISLYNRQVQMAVQASLKELQFRREVDRYVESLWGEGSLEKVKSMADSIATIAVQRFRP